MAIVTTPIFTAPKSGDRSKTVSSSARRVMDAPLLEKDQSRADFVVNINAMP
jgi:hypothetical protein